MDDPSAIQQSQSPADVAPPYIPQPPVTSASVLGPKPELTASGFLGPKQPTTFVEKAFPPGVLNRIGQGGALTRIAKEAASAYSNGAAGVKLPDSAIQQGIKDSGLDYDPSAPPSFTKGLRWWSQALLYPAAKAGDFVNQVMAGTKEALVGGTTQAAKEAGADQNTAEQIGAGVGAMAEYATTDVTLLSFLGRGEIDGTNGKLRDAFIGPLTKPSEVAGQAAAVANGLGLGDDAANTIVKAYNEKGVMPAEIHNDAQNPSTGVLRDLVNGKVPEAYPTTDWMGGQYEAKPGHVTVGFEGGPKEVTPSPNFVTPGLGVSKIGKSIEAKSIEAGLTEGFKGTALYDKTTVEEQGHLSAGLINGDIDAARAVVRGEQPLPGNLKGVALIKGMEDYIKKNPSPELAEELANSPLVSATSGAAQELRLAQERTPDSATANLQQVKDTFVRRAGGAKKVAENRVLANGLKSEASGVLLPKEELSWNKFLTEIRC